MNGIGYILMSHNKKTQLQHLRFFMPVTPGNNLKFKAVTSVF